MKLDDLKNALTIPVVVAPMLLVSGPDLTIAACNAGLLGSFPAANARTTEALEEWLRRIENEVTPLPQLLGGQRRPYAVNLIVRGAGEPRFEADLALLTRFKVPIVITSVGDPTDIVQAVHAYGGLVFHDIATMRHADKAIGAGVDGLIVLTWGAGGHTGAANPFALVPQIRRKWEGAVLLAGAISDGQSIHAAEVLGADFAYMGTRFAATLESLAPQEYKSLLVSQQTNDILVTDRVSGLNATFMKGSISAVGLDPAALPPTAGLFKPQLPHGLKAWRDIWSAGHGVGLIDDIPSVQVLADRLAAEYHAACSRPRRQLRVHHAHLAERT